MAERATPTNIGRNPNEDKCYPAECWNESDVKMDIKVGKNGLKIKLVHLEGIRHRMLFSVSDSNMSQITI